MTPRTRSALAFMAAASIVLAVLPAQPATADAPATIWASGNYNGRVQIDVTESNGVYVLADPTRPGVRCVGPDGRALVIDPGHIGTPQYYELVAACVDVLYGVQRMWDMLRHWLGRNGIDGNGRGVPARVGTRPGTPYNPSFVDFPRGSDGRYPVAVDLVAHEYGHVIFRTTPGGAGSGNESGGLNEGTGDIFGALTEHYANNPNDPPDYLVGEEVATYGGRPLRNMYNPSALGHPNCYSASIPNTEVHAAAGPLNHWFYLLAEGSEPGGGKPSSPVCTGGSAPVVGIGIRQAGQIFMAALNRKTSGWRYAGARKSAVEAAAQLFGQGSPACATTKAAWSGVSVPAQPGEAGCGIIGEPYSAAVSPSSVTLPPGGAATATIITSGSDPQTLTLSARGLPSGCTITFSPAAIPVGHSSVLTIVCGPATPPGTYQITVNIDSPWDDRTLTLLLIVAPEG
ncbi:M4 family metallopeptidase [Nonomuraea sp. NN258]|uniref:M4 family metallopeptidase n=1 Tax=Nonomuraea antri TaxID=2730852 RepID=UPI001569766F|nr:M4 family metallopeptidase [Nonomuraea antri]NRQ35338.1 M4 family metallopeptidase [Nonomuraea antri]